MEVPVVGSDAVQWIKVKVSSRLQSSVQNCAPPTQDGTGSITVGGHCDYLIWHTHESSPNILEITEWSFRGEPPKFGLQLVFEDNLTPLVYILKSQTRIRGGHYYLLYAITTSGVAYLVRLKVPTAYNSGSLLASSDLKQVDITKNILRIEIITAAAAAAGILCIGGKNGSVLCYGLDQVDDNPAQDYSFELREGEVGLGRLLEYMRRKTDNAIKSLEIVEATQKKLLFSLHKDGNLRIWDLVERYRLFHFSLFSTDVAGFEPRTLFLGEPDDCLSKITVVALFRSSSDSTFEKALLYDLNLVPSEAGGRTSCISPQCIPLERGIVIDIKISSDKVWLLTKDASGCNRLLHFYIELGNIFSYQLQDQYVVEQLFQSSDSAIDEVLLAHSSLYSAKKFPFPLSNLFLLKLLRPGIRQYLPMRKAFELYGRHLSESDFHSLTIEGLRDEILGAVHDKVVSDNQTALAYEWKNFCAQYVNLWNHYNKPYGLLFEPSSEGIGLIRRQSISMIRDLYETEQLVHDYDDSAILKGILDCTSLVLKHLGKPALDVFYESLVKPSNISFLSVISRFLKILDAGFDFSVLKESDSVIGLDVAVRKEQRYHLLHRKFSITIILCLQALCEKASGWTRVLEAVEQLINKLIPGRFTWENHPNLGGPLYNINTTSIVQGASQISELCFQESCALRLFLGYLVKLKGQVSLDPSYVERIQISLIPRVEELLIKWFIIHWLSTSSSEASPVEDFSSQLSMLHIADSKSENKNWERKLGTGDLTLAGIVLFGYPYGSVERKTLSTGSLPVSNAILDSIKKFLSWVFWGENASKLPNISNRAIAISTILLQYRQYGVLENLFITLDEQTNQSRYSASVSGANVEWCTCNHLLGLCYLARARLELQDKQRDKYVEEAIRCFFRTASGEEASKELQELSFHTYQNFSGLKSRSDWKLKYFEWIMQIFDQQGLSGGARQFAYAALEQVDEAFESIDRHPDDPAFEEIARIKGRLWANVFKFSTDLEQYKEAYCAIISSPDIESKHVCLRGLLLVLCEHKQTQILCNGELPFVGLLDKVDQELSWKADSSDVRAKPNPYKLLYAFHMYRKNWRKAASYIYQYTCRLKNECNIKIASQLSLTLQERLEGLAAAVNALHLVDPGYAWIDSEQQMLKDGTSSLKEDIALIRGQEKIVNQLKGVDIEQLENEYVLTLGQLQLVVKGIKHQELGGDISPSDLITLLVQSGLYEVSFSVILRIWKESSLKRELEKVFQIMAEQRCTTDSSLYMKDTTVNSHLMQLTSEEEGHEDKNKLYAQQPLYSNGEWHMLKLYLEKYRTMHSRLPLVVAETLLSKDPHMDLPLWLVDMFKGVGANSWGMTGNEADCAALFRLYIEYGRISEATYLLLELIETWDSLRPVDLFKRKRMSAVWFPYSSVERLYSLLHQQKNAYHLSDQCDKLKKLLDSALSNHLKKMKVDSDDVQFSESSR